MAENKTKPLPDNVDHWAQLKNSEFLGHWDIPVGKDFKVVIDLVNMEELTHPSTFKKEWKSVMSFKNGKKRLVLNTTNMRAVASWHGNNPKTWGGKTITLFRALTKLKGEEVECVRVRPDPQAKVRNASSAATEALQKGE
jgi:hypothetical protein